MNCRLSVVLLAVSASQLWGQTPKFRPAKNEAEAVQRIEELGGAVRYLSKNPADGLEVDIQFADSFADEHLQYLASLRNVRLLRLKNTNVSDAGL